MPDELTDDCSDLDGLPYMDLLYRHTRAGYSLQSTTHGQEDPTARARKLHGKGKAPDPRQPSYKRADFIALYRHMQLLKMGTGRPFSV